MSCPPIVSTNINITPCLPVFPGQYSIPPPCFYNIQGLTEWLNQNPQYKQYFVGAYPYLYDVATAPSTFSSIQYNVANVPLKTNVQKLSQGQQLMYNQQIYTFRKIYAYNSNAYVNYKCTGVPPIYYTFQTYKEKTEYNAAISLINKLYPFRAMANASTLNWEVPFPING